MSAASQNIFATEATAGGIHASSDGSHSLRYLERLARQTLPRRETFERSVEVMAFEPGEVIFESNEEFPYLFALLKGGVKTRVSVHGAERLTSIARPGELLGSLSSILPAGLAELLGNDVVSSNFGAESGFGLTNTSGVAFTHSVVERFDMRVLQALMERHAAWAMAGYHAMALYALSQERRVRDLLTLSAEDRYVNFLVDVPEMIGVLPQKDIAAYVGVTPVGLSRIATRVREVSRLR